jgi:hypothetical protein
MQEPAIFSKLAGHMIYIWFSDPVTGLLAKPFRQSETDAIEYLIRELAAYEPRTEQLLVAGPPHEQAPDLGASSTPSGATFYATPFVKAVPSSMLFSVAGFEIGISYSTFITLRDAWWIVQKLVDDHDKPGVDILLISAGAPDGTGTIFPAEEALAEFLTQHGRGLSRPPEHIKSILLHSWTTASATCLYPEFRPIFGPLFGATVPVHQTIIDVSAQP